MDGIVTKRIALAIMMLLTGRIFEVLPCGDSIVKVELWN
jgi:hypothetical protein